MHADGGDGGAVAGEGRDEQQVGALAQRRDGAGSAAGLGLCACRRSARGLRGRVGWGAADGPGCSVLQAPRG